MESKFVDEPNLRHSHPRKLSWNLAYVACFTAGLAVASLRGYGPSHLAALQQHSGFGPGISSEPHGTVRSWLDIEPSESLRWQQCPQVYSGAFHCARLTVPMDYDRPLNASPRNPKVHIALLMVPGESRTADPSSYSSSPLLVNPGGPGGSGVAFAFATGPKLQTVVGRNRDIIGFDPRGVGASTPKADCFASSDDPSGVNGQSIALMNRLNWLTGAHDVGLVNSSNVALDKLNTRAQAIAKLCRRADESAGAESIFRHMGTPSVARDMVSIVDAWHEWRMSSAVKPAKPVQRPEPADPPPQLRTNPEIAASRNTTGKLVYWGFSYGTLLGATFASMFPDKVGRLVLDGVVDADRYVGPTWMESISDTDAIWDRFFIYCAQAGPACQLYRFGDRPAEIQERFEQVMKRLEKQPTIVLLRNTNQPLLVTASDVKSLIFLALYTPTQLFPFISIVLNLVIEDSLDELLQGTTMATLCRDVSLLSWPDDALKAVACGDKRYELNEDVPGLKEIFETAASYSSFADVWMGVDVNIGCNRWQIESRDPPMRWDDRSADTSLAIETSFPILFMSSTLDPVTPLHGAVKMARKFANASIVEQHSEGHCTISCVSLCTINHIRAYLDEGIVPPAPESDSGAIDRWPTCECNEKPWRSLDCHSGHIAMDCQSHRATREHVTKDVTPQELEVLDAYSQVGSYLSFSSSLQHLTYDNPFRGYFANKVMV
ncbi:TAP-like protein-domain-containing protein [Xylariomycetidae sp. FL0641]|nr:TAP-like protein-domain-containing protein [Xylariomycetidae sp. FL0641]